MGGRGFAARSRVLARLASLALLVGYDKLINSTIYLSDQLVSWPAAVSDSSDPVRVILPFKDQSSTDIVRRQLPDLSHKIHNLLFLTYFYILHVYMLIILTFSVT